MQDVASICDTRRSQRLSCERRTAQRFTLRQWFIQYQNPQGKERGKLTAAESAAVLEVFAQLLKIFLVTEHLAVLNYVE